MPVEAKRASLDEFKALAKKAPGVGEPMAGGQLVLCKGGTFEIKAVAGEEYAREFIASTGDVDRDKDTIRPDGWDLANYNKAGSFLWAHNRSLTPIAAPIATWIEGSALKTRQRFAPPDMPHELGMGFGNTVMRLFDGGFLKGVSVAFIPIEWAFNEERGFMAMDFKRQELLEISATPVPSNPNALVQARSKGINVDPLIAWAETVRDAKGGLYLPKDAAEQILAQAKSATVISIAAPAPVTPDGLKAALAETKTEPAPAAEVVSTQAKDAEPEPASSAGPNLTSYEKAMESAEAAEAVVVGAIKTAATLIAKSGRVLSKKNEDDLRAASDLILAVLAQVDPPDDGKAAETSAVAVTKAEIQALVAAAFDSQIHKLTGRLPR
jgi:hypothetical protein